MGSALNLQIASSNILAVFTILQCPKHIGGFLSSSFLSTIGCCTDRSPGIDEWFLMDYQFINEDSGVLFSGSLVDV